MKLRFEIPLAPPLEAEGPVAEIVEFLRAFTAAAEAAAVVAPPTGVPLTGGYVVSAPSIASVPMDKVVAVPPSAARRVACPKCGVPMKAKGLSIHLSKTHGIRGRTKAASRSSARTDADVPDRRAPSRKEGEGSTPSGTVGIRVPPAARRAEEPSRPLDHSDGVGAWIRRKGPPFGHSIEQLHRIFSNVSEATLRGRAEQFRFAQKSLHGGFWSKVNEVWTWAEPASPPGSGTGPSDATSTETKS